MTNSIQKEFSFTSRHVSAAPRAPHLIQYIAKLSGLLGDAKERGVNSYDSHEHALLLPIDEAMSGEVVQLAKQIAGPELKYIVVIGIGGSNLGTKAVYDALYGSFDLAGKRMPKLLFLDTLSQGATEAVIHLLTDLEQSDGLLINLISKSGTTAESVANFELLYHALEKRFPDISSRVVCTTDRDSALWQEALRRNFRCLPIPALVGGRFSVFSPVGLFPLLCAGIDVEGLRTGGADMLHEVLSSDMEHNPAHNAATELFAAMHAGCAMLNIFHFNPELESLGKWERQLFAESLGKEKDLDGNTVHSGVTPIVSVGSTDLHSMAQLYLGGPRDKFTMLVRAQESGDEKIAPESMLAPLVQGIMGKSAADIMEAIYGGVCAAYDEHKLPSLQVQLSEISPYTIGAYMEWRMATVMYLATLMNVNAFDQPNVEDYKSVTRKLLSK
jgi:glucose-6-phosphate isomerase